MLRQRGQTSLEDPRGQATRTQEFSGEGPSRKVLIPRPEAQKDRPPGGAQHGDRPLEPGPNEEDQGNRGQR
jgi:hypothetical protein